MASALLAGKNIEEIPLEPVSDQGDAIVSTLADIKAGRIGLVAGADKIEEIAMASGLGTEMSLNPRMVGIDISNRGGQGVSTLEVALLANDIVEDGWSWAMVKHTTCIEERPGASDIWGFQRKTRGGFGLGSSAEG